MIFIVFLLLSHVVSWVRCGACLYLFLICVIFLTFIMVFHENNLLANDSHEVSYLFFQELGKMSQKLPSAAVVIGAFRVK